MRVAVIGAGISGLALAYHLQKLGVPYDLFEAGAQVGGSIRLMKKTGMKSIVRKKYRVQTTDSTHAFAVAGNHLGRDFIAQRPAEKWVSGLYTAQNQQKIKLQTASTSPPLKHATRGAYLGKMSDFQISPSPDFQI